jgi:acetylglutamate kinase
MNARQQQIVRTLLEALPYIRRFNGATIVVACEGAALHSERLRRWLAEDLALLRLVGMKPALVHEEMDTPVAEAMVSLVKWHGAPATSVVDPATAALARLVDEAVLDIPVAVLDIPVAVPDGLMAVPAVPTAAPDTRVSGEPPAAVGEAGQAQATSVASVAGEIAATLTAEKLMFLADVEGIHDNDPVEQAVISECGLDELGRLQAVGAIDASMLPAVQAVRRALEAGVASAHIIDGRIEHALLLEILTDAGCGTKITLAGPSAVVAATVAGTNHG